MKDIFLDNRLQSVFDEISPCDCLVDIGTDHGKIPIKAVLNHLCNRAIAIDISAASLEKAKLAVAKFGVSDMIECRVGDGASVVYEHEFDTVIIAGMGGIEIASIINNAANKFNKYILLPHRNSMQLREYLSINHICCTSDYMTECNGKYYNLIVATVGEYYPTAIELKYGKSRNTAIFKGFIAKEIEKIKKILNKKLSLTIELKMIAELNELKELYESITNC